MEKSTYINLFMSVSSEDIMPEGSIARIVIDEHKVLRDEIERLREALDKYDCSCTEPCALYKMEKKRESEMPHMVCGWWASAALKKGE